LSGTPAPGCGTGPPVATSSAAARRTVQRKRPGVASELDPEAYRHTGPPPTCHRPDAGVARRAPAAARSAVHSPHPDRACLLVRWPVATSRAGCGRARAGSRAARPRGGRPPARPPGPAQRWDGRGRRELQWPAWLVGQAHLGVGVAVFSASTVSLSLQGMGGSLLVGRRWPREVREWASRLRRPGLAVVERGRQVVVAGGGPAAVGDGLRGRLRLLTRGWGGHGRFGRRGSRCGPGRAL
jgi:hypothetical protein